MQSGGDSAAAALHEHDEPYRVGGHPWAGNEARAKVEAARLTRETGGRWVARRVAG